MSPAAAVRNGDWRIARYYSESIARPARSPRMTAVHRGALLSSLTMLAITLLWSAMAGIPREGTCTWSHACLCHPMPMTTFLFGGLFVGVPAGGIGGALVGALVARFPRHRRLILMVTAFAAASA